MIIKSNYTIGASLIEASQDEIKRQPMLHRADFNFALVNGGHLANEFLGELERIGWCKDRLLIDSRVHMLMPGMFPCIPGWHHDDVPRQRIDGQPNYVNPSYNAEHCMALWGDCSLTEFATGSAEFEIPALGQKIYKVWNPLVENFCAGGVLDKTVAPERRMILFNSNTWHRGAETTKMGFRYFIRATRKSDLPARNEIRYNANVYMPVLDEGW